MAAYVNTLIFTNPDQKNKVTKGLYWYGTENRIFTAQPGKALTPHAAATMPSPVLTCESLSPFPVRSRAIV